LSNSDALTYATVQPAIEGFFPYLDRVFRGNHRRLLLIGSRFQFVFSCSFGLAMRGYPDMTGTHRQTDVYVALFVPAVRVSHLITRAVTVDPYRSTCILCIRF